MRNPSILCVTPLKIPPCVRTDLPARSHDMAWLEAAEELHPIPVDHDHLVHVDDADIGLQAPLVGRAHWSHTRNIRRIDCGKMMASTVH